ncbi:uncharacterized protein DEA37_0008126 [Paragonimus westermani]|uniref:Microtubule-associated protein 1A/B/S-like MBL-like domain-containing protein n=1 Tax=Paragonimus westermani TaxID=34504 RepID=A0A5J4NYK0_9TREM|nr:uncharacterized protein DEA37_0008126 [Paragonimus westermani]
MAARSTLIVAGRMDGNLSRDRLSKLLFNCLISAFGEEAPGADVEFSQLAAKFVKPTSDGEFGLSTSNAVTPLHLVRAQYNPTAEQFRVALREAMSHALNAGRMSQTEASVDGRVHLIYTGKVLAHTGEWLLADCSLAGHQVVSWLDGEAARVWWPQIDKFPNTGDRLHIHLFTPLAGLGTCWPMNKNGHPQTLLSHVDVRLVRLTLSIEGSWRSNGKLVTLDPVHTASYDGTRSFVQLCMDQHPVTLLQLTFDDPPLGCALSAQRPALYIFPGGGLTSQASALFSIQGFTMLLGGSYTAQAPPSWWAMARNLPKLDAILYPDWTAPNLLSYRFVTELLQTETNESKVIGELLLPPSCLSSNEPVNELLLTPPDSNDNQLKQQSAWAPNNLASENLPSCMVLYSKLGWGELNLQPLAQRAGLVLLWKSSSCQQVGNSSSPLSILLPITQLTSATPVQGLGRLLKALANAPHLGRGPATAKRTEKPMLGTTVKSTGRTPLPKVSAIGSAPAANKPVSSTRPHTATQRTTYSAAKSATANPPKRPSSAMASPPRRLVTVTNEVKSQARLVTPAPPKSAPSKTTSTAPPKQTVVKSKVPTTADRLSTHANLVASKQAPAATKLLPKPKTPTTLPVTKELQETPTHRPTAKSPVTEANHAVKPSDNAEKIDQQLRDSLELAPMDPLTSGWRSMEHSGPVQPSLPPAASQSAAQHEPSISPALDSRQPPVQELGDYYKVHKFERFNEADEAILDDLHTSLVHNEFATMKTPASEENPIEQPTTPTEGLSGENELVAHDVNFTDKSRSPDVVERAQFEQPVSVPPPTNDHSVASVLKLIDPAVVDSYHDGLHLAEAVDTEQMGRRNSSPELHSPVRSDTNLSGGSFEANEAIAAHPEHNESQDVIEPAGDLPPNYTGEFLSCAPTKVGMEDEAYQSSGARLSISDRSPPATQDTQSFSRDHSPVLEEGLADQQVLSDLDREYAAGMVQELISADSQSGTQENEVLPKSVEEASEYLGNVPEDSFYEKHMGLPATFEHPAESPVLEAHSPEDTVLDYEVSQPSLTHEVPDGDKQVVNKPYYSPFEAVDLNRANVHENNHPGHVGEKSSRPQSVQRDGSDISDVETNDREFWFSGTPAQPQPQYSPAESSNQPADSEPPSRAAHPEQNAQVSGAYPHSDKSDKRNEGIIEEAAEAKPLFDNMEGALYLSDQPSHVSVDSLDGCCRFDQSFEDHVGADSTIDLGTHDGPLSNEPPPLSERPTSEQEQLADSTTVEDGQADVKETAALPPIGFDQLLSVDPSGDHLPEQTNLGSPLSDTSVDSVVHNMDPKRFTTDLATDSPVDDNQDLVTSSQPGLVDSQQHLDSLSDPHQTHIGFDVYSNGIESHQFFTNGNEKSTNGFHCLSADDESTNGHQDYPVTDPLSQSDFSPKQISKNIPDFSSGFDVASNWNPDTEETMIADGGKKSPHPKYDIDLPREQIGATQPLSPDSLEHQGQPHSGGPSTNVDSSLDQFDPVQAWGQPQGLPAPTLPTTGSKVAPANATPPPTLPPSPPVYLDLIWVPEYLTRVPHNLAVEFFSRVRAQTYVISGEALHPMMGEALLEGKAKWDPKDVEKLCRTQNSSNAAAVITVLPTTEPYEWSCWLRTPCGRLDRETGESRLQANGFHVLPAASLCDIEYSAGNVAFRCEGVRVDF